MATEDEIRLGRLVVTRGLATEEQVLGALRERNAKPKGLDLAAILEARGLVPSSVVAQLRVAVAGGAGLVAFDRTEQSTDHEISIQGTREVIARDQLEEALRVVDSQPVAAHRELKRLAEEFSDTESGVRAEREARALEARHRHLGGPG